MQAITVHKANVDDAAEVLRMQQALAAYESETTRATLEGIRRLLAGETKPQCHCLLAKAGSQNAGFVLYYDGYDLGSVSEGFHLADLFVEEMFREQGVGSRLLSEMAAHANAEGRKWISLTTLTGNRSARQFYTSKGFAEMPVRFFALGSSGLAPLLDKKI